LSSGKPLFLADDLEWNSVLEVKNSALVD